jgi:hypothetical protein
MKLEEAIRQTARQHELQLVALAQQEQQAFDDRIKEMEGTAKDLQQFGWLGKIVIFLRGMQRPLWGFFVLYLDYMVFIGNKWPTVGMQQGPENVGLDFKSAFWIINFLVLGFLFGERAMRNVLPLIQQRLGKTGSGQPAAKG